MKDCKELERLLDDNSNNVHHEHKHRHNHHQHHHVHGGGHAHPSFVTLTSNGVSGMCENDRLSHHHHHHHHVHGGLGHPSFVTQTSNGVSGMCEVDPLSHHHHVHGGHAQTSNGVSGMYEDDPSSYYKYTSVSSPASVFSLQSNGSSSSLFSVGHALSDNGSPTPPSPVEFKSQLSCGTSQYLNGSCLDLKLPDSPLRNRKNTNERLVDELGLCRNLSKMYVSHEQQNSSSFGGFSVGQGRIRLGDGSLNGINQSKVDNYSVYRNFSGPFSDNVGFQCSTPRNSVSFGGQMTSSVLGLQQGHRMGNLMSSQWSTGEPSSFFSEFNGHNNPMSSPRQRIKEQRSNYNQIGSPIPSRVTTFGGMSPAEASFYLQPNGMNPTNDIVLLNSLNSPQVSQTRPMSSPRQRVKEHTSNYNQIGSPIPSRATTFDGMSPADALFYLQPNGMNSTNDSVLMNSLNSPQVSQTRPPHWNVESLVYGLPTTDGLTRASPNFRLGGPEALTSEDSFIIQGEGMNYVVNSGLDRAKGQRRSALCNLDVSLERSQQDGRCQIAPSCENSRNRRVFFPFSSPVKYNSLPEIQGCIGLIAMDQHGCRFLQRMLDEGTPEDVQTIFNEIIENVVELMMNPFGNYLMQKLLEVCNEEQRMQIVVMVTARPRELVRISLNNHGTRAVQKLIETLKTRQQISLVISALEPGFLSLIKDVNGNHVVQRCLQCLSIEDNKFIFAGSTRFCVDIATHQHGCCVLQRCIARSTGVHQENLVAEILANAHLLSQDNYGNYVVQFVMDLNIPSATSTLVSQFQGSYVYLSMQKFSSHVVEKCLIVGNDEDRSKIIHELLASSLFEQLLRDPLANYVIQKALEFSQGAIYKLLVEAIEPYRSRLRNCPYSKRIFSSKLLKK